MTKPNSRTSALAKKHKDLGSGLEDWNGMGTAWSYNRLWDNQSKTRA